MNHNQRGSLYYDVNCVNFLQVFNKFPDVSTLQRTHENTPYFVVVNREKYNETIYEAKVHMCYVHELLLWYKDNNSLYFHINIYENALNEFPKYGIFEEVIVYSN